MKTTKKKGFTLIELIVVIAIIGVLAAILVPTMLGYVKKSKISSANSAASSVYKAINSALTELDEEGVDVGGLWILEWDGSEWKASTTSNTVLENVGSGKRFDAKVTNFFEDIKKIKKGKAALKGGSCIALSMATDTTYTGTYPGGIVTSDTYEAYSDTAYTDALVDAIKAASGCKAKGKADGTKGSAARMTFDGEATNYDGTDYATLGAGVATNGKKNTTT